MQIPLIAAQNHSTKEQLPIVNALVVFSQNFWGAVFLSIGELTFSNTLKSRLLLYAPEVDPAIVIAAGASAVNTAVPVASLPGVLLAYSRAFDSVMYLVVGISVCSFLSAFGIGWKNIKKPKATQTASEPEA